MNKARPPGLILASSSPYRRQLLSQLGIAFEHISPDIDESPLPDESPESMASRLAGSKALAVAETRPDHIVIGSDQTAACQGELLQKPGSVDNASRQLAKLSGQTVRFHTALCVMHLASGFSSSDIETVEVRFRQLTPEQIARYLEKEPAVDCVGAFKCEGLGITLLESISTKDPNTLIGLPLIQLTTRLLQLGITLP